jgi:Pilus formation protein N terminal region
MMGIDVRKILMPIAALLAAIQLVGVVCPVLAGEMSVISNDATSRYLPLVISKAVVLRLPTPIKDVLVADPTIATAVVKSPTLVYIIGLSVGATNIYFFDAQQNQIDGLDVAVLPVPTRLESTPTAATSVNVFFGPLASQTGGGLVGRAWGEFVIYSCTIDGCATVVQPGVAQVPGTQNINITGNGAGSVIVPAK